MGWRTLQIQDIVSRMTAAEQAMLAAASGAKNALGTRLTDAILAFQSAMQATGFQVGAPNQIEDSFRNAVMSYGIWEWIKDFPSLKTFATDARRDAYREAMQELNNIRQRKCGAILPPSGYNTSGNWNSSNFVVGRMAPTPPPAAQFQNVGNPFPMYANPNATSEEVLLQVPAAPKNCWLFTGVAGELTLNWDQPSNAFFFNIWKGTATGAETLLASNFRGISYLDKNVTIGTQYFYCVVAGNQFGLSTQSNEASATVLSVSA